MPHTTRIDSTSPVLNRTPHSTLQVTGIFNQQSPLCNSSAPVYTRHGEREVLRHTTYSERKRWDPTTTVTLTHGVLS